MFVDLCQGVQSVWLPVPRRLGPRGTRGKRGNPGKNGKKGKRGTPMFPNLFSV